MNGNTFEVHLRIRRDNELVAEETLRITAPPDAVADEIVKAIVRAVARIKVPE
jgi:hypothetical protein